MTTIGLLNPGEMGSMVGAAVRSGGARVLWAGEGRSAATRKRASDAGLEDAGSVAAVARASDVILSVCPPHAAVDLATQVAALRFAGTYVDGNAVSPATAREVGGIVEKGGATFVDGGIIGPPPVKPTKALIASAITLGHLMLHGALPSLHDYDLNHLRAWSTLKPVIHRPAEGVGNADALRGRITRASRSPAPAAPPARPAARCRG